MKFRLLTNMYLLFFIVVLFVSFAFGKSLESGTTNNGLIEIGIKKYIESRFGKEDKITVEVISVTPDIAGAVAPPITISTRKKGILRGRTVFQVTFTNRGKKEEHQVLALVKRFQEVVITSQLLERNDVIAVDDVQLELCEVNWSTHEKLVSMKDIIGKRATRRLSPGRVLTESMVENVPVIEHGSLVNMEFISKGLSLSLPVQACQDGCVGEVIKVKNMTNGAYYLAAVESPDKVTFEQNKSLR